MNAVHGPTLTDVLRKLRDIHNRGFVFLQSDLSEREFAFPELVAAAEVRAGQLIEAGGRPGDRVGLVAPDAEDFVLTFLGAVIAGLIPVPIAPPFGLGKLDSYWRILRRILEVSGATLLVSGDRVFARTALPAPLPATLRRALTIRDLKGFPNRAGRWRDADPQDTCFLQFTSGSTSDPKGVVVSHGNVVANAKAIMIDGLDADPETERGVTWLPLFHDMGLVGHVLAPICIGGPCVFLPTLAFAKRPTLWMWAVHKWRGNITFAPNFAFAVAARRGTTENIEELDLSCLRAVGCGGEPINAGTLRQFSELMGRGGLKPEAVMPCYGMAEATLAVTFDSWRQPFHTTFVDREAYERGRADAAPGGTTDGSTLEIVSCGRTFPGHEVAVLGEDGRPLPDRYLGRIFFRGPSVAQGYFNDPEATAAAFRDGWLSTGDLGFVLDGDLYVAGRTKEVLIVNGRNYYPQTIEWVAEQVDGVRLNGVAAFASGPPDQERLVVVAEVQAPAMERSAQLIAAIRDEVRLSLGIKVDEVQLVRPRTLPKTSSGKVQRVKVRQTYEEERRPSRSAEVAEVV